MRYASSRPDSIDTGAVLHGFMYTERFPSAIPGEGFTTQLSQSDSHLVQAFRIVFLRDAGRIRLNLHHAITGNRLERLLDSHSF